MEETMIVPQNAAQQIYLPLLAAKILNGHRLNPGGRPGTPPRLPRNIKVMTVDGEDVRLTRGERKRQRRAKAILGPHETAPHHMHSHARKWAAMKAAAPVKPKRTRKTATQQEN